MKLGILWADWIAQPPEHAALYMIAHEARLHMDAFDDGERSRHRAAEARRNEAGRGRR